MRLNVHRFFVAYSIVITMVFLAFVDSSMKPIDHSACINENFKLYKIIVKQSELISRITHPYEWDKYEDSLRIVRRDKYREYLKNKIGD